jgi:hypothetical protein
MVLMSMAVGSEVVSSIHLVTLILLASHSHNTIQFLIHISPPQIMCMIGTSDRGIVPESVFASYTESIIYSILVLASYQ